ncbi:DUF72 domain-containing protein [Salisaeta longa]|uniref:DUF72 domain-containing protein n=1 Tax=Salisaeta longa TaxID=503170 RepID=UPI0003B369BC|nr:DUF72 domain-containing protein [Salisaeta longa]
MSTSLPARSDRTAAVERFDFRSVHPRLRFGTASDRYAGWIGQIYPEGAYDTTARRRTLAGRRFEERKVPVASVADYFQHFNVLEIDFTFYQPLLTDDNAPSRTLHTLRTYAAHAPADARFLVKAPQQYIARSLRRGGDFVANDTFLALDAYRTRFHAPLQECLGDRLAGIIFQQEYQRTADSPSPQQNVDTLDAFFAPLAGDVPLHLELRSEHLLTDVYFDWLATRGLGFVFSHWTWLPMIREQWSLCDGRFTSGPDEAVARLLTPRDMKYADAYAAAHPFDAPAEALAETPQAHAMVLDTVALAYQALDADVTLNVVANNRAWGNAPDLARTIAQRFLAEEEKRAA